MANGNGIIITGAVLQIFLLGFLVRVVHPQVTFASVSCILLLTAAEIFIFRELRELRMIAAQDRLQRTARSRGTYVPAVRRPSEKP